MKLLGVSGSLRQASTNGALLRAFAESAPSGITMEILTGIADLPAFNPDLQDGLLPASVARLDAAIAESSGVIFAVPEYAHGIPGALKNALDWLVAGATVPGKPAMLVHASSRSQISRLALREILKTMSFALHDSEELEVSLLGKTPAEVNGILADPATRQRLTEALSGFGAFISSQATD